MRPVNFGQMWYWPNQVWPNSAATLEARQILRRNLDAPLIVTADAQVHVTEESVELHPCPCLTTHSREHSVGDDLFLIRPVRVQAARCLSSGSSGSWHPLHVASVKGNGSCKRSSNRTLNKWGRTVNSTVVACEKTTPAFRPECERKWAWRLVSIEFFQKWVSRTEETQYCQPCGHSPGSRVSLCGGRLPACSSAHAGRHQNPFWSNSVAAACNSPKHPSTGFSWPNLRTTSTATSVFSRWSCEVRQPRMPNTPLERTSQLNRRIHFHPKTISSTDTFIQKRFHPILTLSSKRSFIQWTFIQELFHPMNFSSNDTFIQWHFQPTTVSSKNIKCRTMFGCLGFRVWVF